MNRLIILNPNSRNGKARSDFARLFPDIEARLGKNIVVCRTKAPGDATDLVAAALQGTLAPQQSNDDRFDQILIAGGDGTINEAVNGYVVKDGQVSKNSVPLGIINLGTGGDLFRTATELSRDYDQALLENRHSMIDLGIVKCGAITRHFINIASVGMAGKMLKSLKKSPFQSGAVAYFYHSIKTLIAYRPTRVEIEYLDGEGNRSILMSDLINFFICNGRCSGGGMRWAPTAEFQNGLLELTLIDGLKKLPLITQSPKVYAGKIDEFPGARQMQAQSVTIRSEVPISIECDGEILNIADQDVNEIHFGIKERVFPLLL